MTPDREIRALARALGCERREVVQALEAAELLQAERRPAPKLQRQAAAIAAADCSEARLAEVFGEAVTQ